MKHVRDTQCGKTAYTSRNRCEKVKQRRERESPARLRIYWHDVCGCWHLTKQEQAFWRKGKS